MSEDLVQEHALALAISKKYGNRSARTGLRVVARKQLLRRKWFISNEIRVPRSDVLDAPCEDTTYQRILVRELIELLPYAARVAVIVALETQNERKIQLAGRLAKESLPPKTLRD